MLYILFWEQKEMPPDERERFSEKAREERGKEEKYGKEIFPPHFYETGKGITIVDIFDPKQLANRMAL